RAAPFSLSSGYRILGIRLLDGCSTQRPDDRPCTLMRPLGDAESPNSGRAGPPEIPMPESTETMPESTDNRNSRKAAVAAISAAAGFDAEGMPGARSAALG